MLLLCECLGESSTPSLQPAPAVLTPAQSLLSSAYHCSCSAPGVNSCLNSALASCCATSPSRTFPRAALMSQEAMRYRHPRARDLWMSGSSTSVLACEEGLRRRQQQGGHESMLGMGKAAVDWAQQRRLTLECTALHHNMVGSASSKQSMAAACAYKLQACWGGWCALRRQNTVHRHALVRSRSHQ